MSAHIKLMLIAGIVCILILAELALMASLPSVSPSPSYAQDEGGTPTPAPTAPPLIELNEDIIKRATVFVMQTYQNRSQTVISCVGSGTLVSGGRSDPDQCAHRPTQ